MTSRIRGRSNGGSEKWRKGVRRGIYTAVGTQQGALWWSIDGKARQHGCSQSTAEEPSKVMIHGIPTPFNSETVQLRASFRFLNFLIVRIKTCTAAKKFALVVLFTLVAGA